MMGAATLSRGSSLTRMVADIATEHREMDRSWTELRAIGANLTTVSQSDSNALNITADNHSATIVADPGREQ